MSAAGVAAWASLGADRFVRVCPDHRFEVVQLGGSTLTCPQGHDVEIWIVLDTREMDRARRRGLFGGPADGGELCRICRRDDHQRWTPRRLTWPTSRPPCSWAVRSEA